MPSKINDVFLRFKRRDPFDACAMAARGALSGNTEQAMRADMLNWQFDSR